MTRIRAELLARLRGADTAVAISSGVAELTPGDDALGLYERALRALRGARPSGPAGLDAAGPRRRARLKEGRRCGDSR